MIGAIAGDIIGSVHEFVATKQKDFNLFPMLALFTDDTVLTVAVADAILSGNDYGKKIKSYARRHPLRGYGPRFSLWMMSPSLAPYNSFGNGSAMRVSPVGHAFVSEAEVLEEAKKSAACTHDHPEGIKGAQAIALSIFMARNGATKEAIRQEIASRFDYDLSYTIESIRPQYKFDVTCQGSVPQSIVAFLDSTSYEDCVRNAVSLGGDADTQAAMAGSIAEAYYKNIPVEILQQVKKRLTSKLWDTTLAFYQKFGLPEIQKLLEGIS